MGVVNSPATLGAMIRSTEQKVKALEGRRSAPLPIFDAAPTDAAWGVVPPPDGTLALVRPGTLWARVDGAWVSL